MQAQRQLGDHSVVGRPAQHQGPGEEQSQLLVATVVGWRPEPTGSSFHTNKGNLTALQHLGTLGGSAERGAGWCLQTVLRLAWARGAPGQPHLPTFFLSPRPRARVGWGLLESPT